MREIRDAIKHICENIQNGGKSGGWNAEEMRDLTASVSQLAEADAKLDPRTEMTINEAFKTIFLFCRLYDRCVDCPKQNVCKIESPAGWDISEISSGGIEV